jgi:hypothetical protein
MTSRLTTSTYSGSPPESAKLGCCCKKIADIQTTLVDPRKTPRAETKRMRKDISELFAAIAFPNDFTVIPSTKWITYAHTPKRARIPDKERPMANAATNLARESQTQDQACVSTMTRNAEPGSGLPRALRSECAECLIQANFAHLRRMPLSGVPPHRGKRALRELGCDLTFRGSQVSICTNEDSSEAPVVNAKSRNQLR